MARNKHTSVAGLIYVASGTLAKMACVWFPAHCEQVKQTAEILETFAGGYGLLMAGDAGNSDKGKNQNPDDKSQEATDPMSRTNTLKVFIIGAAVTAALALSAPAQTPSAPDGALPVNIPPTPTNFAALPAPIQGFGTTLWQFVSSFDTNSTTFHGAHELDVTLGADTQAGVSSASLGLNYAVWQIDTNTPVGIESMTRFAGLGGVILSQQAGFSISKVLYDTKFTGYLDGGYAMDRRRMFGEVGVQITKATTPNTFIGSRFGCQVDKDGPHTAIISLLWGVKF